jgi:enoyl-CoA hydratase/carnithine racemase
MLMFWVGARRRSLEDRVKVTNENGVADVRLNRADKMNALDADMFTAIAETGARLKRDQNLRDAEAALTAETSEQKALLGSANQVEAVRANLEKRMPSWSNP